MEDLVRLMIVMEFIKIIIILVQGQEVQLDHKQGSQV
jgi:hypothetical protein